MTVPATTREIQDERIVEEVHCTECNVPIPSIPGWYASVNVRFTCDACRQKSGRSIAALAPPEVETSRSSSDGDSDNDPALDEIDDADIELDDADAEADGE
jgi:hypothetical protein